MKRIFVCAILVIFTGAISTAQSFRLSGYGGYVFDDNVDSYYDATTYYDGKIKGGFQWGVGLEYLLVPAYGLELVYFRQDTKAPLNYYLSGETHTDFDLAINYIMVGGNRYLNADAQITPYAGALMGAAVFNLGNPDTGTDATRTFFAWGLKAGAILKTNSRLSLKLQANLLSSVRSVGGGYYFAAGVGYNSYTSMFQFGFTGALTYELWNSATNRGSKK